MAINATIKNGNLVIELPLQTPTPSATGKTLVVASTHGNAETTVVVKAPGGQDRTVKIGVNAFIKP